MECAGAAALANPPYERQSVVISANAELQEYNPRSGKPYTNQHATSSFVVAISGSSFRLSITNNEWPAWHMDFVYDGTNSYTILPFEKALNQPFAGFGSTNPPSSGLQFVTIEPSDLYIQRGTDNYGVFAAWLTYGLSPRNLRTNALGFVDRPLSGARRHPGGFGYNWVVEPSPDGRFGESCDVVREGDLDLANEDEFFRREIDYPETAEQLKEYKRLLRERKLTRQGYIKLRYSCTDWWRTNDLVMPAASRMEMSLGPVDNSFPWRVVTVVATKVEFGRPIRNFLPEIRVSTHVEDYRYKRVGESRIFKYAEYWLKPGDGWKSANDPVLLGQAENWMRKGPNVLR